MKKVGSILLILAFVLILECSCAHGWSGKDKVDYRKNDYEIGSMGPAGGFIFYDCDADNNSGNADGLESDVCGWRYLEAAPIDLTGSFYWGQTGNCWTESGVGCGAKNTASIVEDARKREEPTTEADVLWGGKVRAAVVCDIYSLNGFRDWFLPSKDELALMYNNLQVFGVGNFGTYNYWSSTENGTRSAWIETFKNGYQLDNLRSYENHIRPIRAF